MDLLGRISGDVSGTRLVLVLVWGCSLGGAWGKGFAVADLGERVDTADPSGGDCTGFCWDPIFLFPGLIAVLFQVVAAVGKSIYLPTLEGSSQVASKAKARAMRFISHESRPRDIPASGRYRAQYNEVSEWKDATYDLKFDPSGVVEGLCVDEDGQFRIYGLYDPSTAGFTWAEYPLGNRDYIINSSPSEIDYFISRARPFHTEVEVKISLSNDTMEGSYHATSNITGKIILQLQHPFFNEYAAISFAPGSTASAAMSGTNDVTTSEPSTSSQNSISHQGRDPAENLSTIKHHALAIMDSARDRAPGLKRETRSPVRNPASGTTNSTSEIEPCTPDDEVVEEIARSRKEWGNRLVSHPIIDFYDLEESCSNSASGWCEGLLRRLTSRPRQTAPSVMPMTRNEDGEGHTERLLEGL